MNARGKLPGQGSRRPTLKTISDVTGLSMSTVSLSLRGGTAIKVETRQKVLKAADDLGYVPDRAGVRLRTGKTNVLSLVLDGRADAIEFTRYLIEGIGHQINGTRYHLNVTPDFGSQEPVDCVEYLLKNQLADGIVLTHTTPNDQRVKLLTETGLPFVTHGRTEFYTPHAYHDFDSESFVRLAVERLVSKGCKTMMLWSPEEKTTNYYTMVHSFIRVAAAHGVQARVSERVGTNATSGETRNLGWELASRPDRPDGIICGSEVMALPLLSGLRDGGTKLGSEMFVVAKQASNILSTVFPEIDIVDEDVVEAGNELARLLLERISGTAVEELQTLGAPKPRWLSVTD